MTEPCKIDEYGNKYWWLNGKFHREDGPAIERADGYQAWYLNGKAHREDGPALISISGFKSWWLNDKFIAEGERPKNWDELVLLSQVEQVMND